MRYELTAEAGTTVVAFDGDVREDIGGVLSEILARIATPAVVLDCQRIELMNSSGLGLWCRFQAELDRKHAVTYRRIPSIMIHFAGITTGFFGRATLESLYVPYFCDPCDARRIELVDAPAFAARRTLLPGVCEACEGPTHPEVDVDGYVEILLDCLGDAV